MRTGIGLGLAAAAAVLACGCAAPPPGANDRETHRGATVIAPGSSPGLNGPYAGALSYPVNGPAHLQGLSPLGGSAP
ncbi:MAG: hypothetical protein ACRYGC_03730 [Janthinobacterium lividum]